MFCPKCGANLPDGAAHCSACGAPVGAPATNLKKKEYIQKLATPATKSAWRLVPLLVAVCIVIMVIGHISMLNTSLEDIPIFSMALEMSGEGDGGMDELKEELEYELEDMEEEYEFMEDVLEEELSKKELKKLEQLFEVMDDCTKTISVNNLKKMADLMADLSDSDAADLLGLGDDMEELEEVSAGISIISTVVLVMSLFSLLFTIIGGLCRGKILVILGAIGSGLFSLAAYSFLFVVLILAVHVVMVIMIGKANKEYKAYRSGTLPANT